MESRKFFLISYVALSVLCSILATWFLGASMEPGSRYEGGWIFGLAWFPLLAFGFIEGVNAQSIPERMFGAIQAVFLPYVWIFGFGYFQHQPFSEMVVSASVATFIAAFALHIYALRSPLRDAGKSAFTEVLIPHLFLYVPAGIVAYMMTEFLWNAGGGSWMFALGLLGAIGQRIYAMHPSLKDMLS
jgi:hypothetical protein